MSEPPLYSRKIHVSVKEFQELMKTKKENGESEHPLETLEELLEVIWRTDNTCHPVKFLPRKIKRD